jgi:flagellar protein FlaF
MIAGMAAGAAPADGSETGGLKHIMAPSIPVASLPVAPSAPAAPAMPLPTADSRQVESWALAEIAGRMEAARNAEPVDEWALVQTAQLNWRLWTIFQTSLLDPDNPLPEEIRDNILALANFVDSHSADIIAEPAADKLDVLIRINRELAAGLGTTG